MQSSAMLVRRDAAEQVGYLDPAFFVYSDETDFCKRLRDARLARSSSCPARGPCTTTSCPRTPPPCGGASSSSTAAATATSESTACTLTRLVWRVCWAWAYLARAAAAAADTGPRPAALPAPRPPGARAESRRGDPRGGGGLQRRAGRNTLSQRPWSTLTPPSSPPSCGAARVACSCCSHADGVLLLAGLLVLAAAEAGLAYSIGLGPLDKLSGPAGVGAALVGPRRRGRRRSGAGAPAGRCSRRRAGGGAVPAAALVRQLELAARVDRRRRPARPAAAALLRARRGRGGARLAGAARPRAASRCRVRSRCPPRRSSLSPALSLLWADDLEAGANLLLFFTLPFAAAPGHGGAGRLPRGRTARPWRPPRSRWPRCSPWSGSGRRPRASSSSTRPTSRSRTRTRTTSGSRRCSATRASTAATWCSAWRSCSRCSPRAAGEPGRSSRCWRSCGRACSSPTRSRASPRCSP